MAATILHFPQRKADAERLALIGSMIASTIPMPERDMELDMLLQIGGKLLDNLNDYRRPDCSGLMDRWLDRLDAWETENAG